LEYLNILGELNTAGSPDFVGAGYSEHFDITQSSFDRSFGGLEEYAAAEVSGRFSRTFEDAINLTFLEVKVNSVMVKAPEPATTVSLLFWGVIGGAIALKKNAQKLPR
jgi:hypothetical protein